MAGTYGQFCPIAMACEVLTERWTPLVMRELLAGSTRFNDLRRGLPLISPSLLSKRLKALERAGVIDRDAAGGYHVTDAGEELRPIIEAMGVWGQRWARGSLDDERLDASLLMWDIRRRIDAGRVPERRVVVHFQLQGSIDRKSRFWLVLDGDDIDLCLTDPGFDADVVVAGHVRDLAAYWRGAVDMEDLVDRGSVRITGAPELVRQVPSWFLRSPFSAVELPVA